MKESCIRPPFGWACTRGYHADGPCAAVPIDPYAGDRLYEFCDKYRHGTSSVRGMTDKLKELLHVQAICMTASGDNVIVPMSELKRIGVKVTLRD